MNGTTASQPPPNGSTRPAKPPPPGPAPPAPATAPPAPPTAVQPAPRTPTAQQSPTTPVNGTQNAKKKRSDPPVDPATMYESVKNRIAALEEEEVLEEEEEKRFVEEAQKSIRGIEENAIHAKYFELFAEFKRAERDHAKEKQKLTKDKDAAKSQLTKANQSKAKIEGLARELQKENKRLREDNKNLKQEVDDQQSELLQARNSLAKQDDKAKLQDTKYREMPDIVIRVICRYRAELYFKISRKTKLSRLFSTFTERMEDPGWKGDGNGVSKVEATKDAAVSAKPSIQFIFTHNGRTLDEEQTPEDAGMEDQDEILAVELMDLTDDGEGVEEWEEHVEPRREQLKKTWNDDPQEARKTLEDIFDGVVRERLKDVLRQYELRERHFECVIRSKELEVLLSRARSAESKELLESERTRADKLDDEVGLSFLCPPRFPAIRFPVISCIYSIPFRLRIPLFTHLSPTAPR
ncbi:hypothetical protein P691DRAFT_810923 [Macrolepiota fuliginosa MF-IS2]|uniref:Ubiquitin-like domain-containing protein n=1 Tax=Macrolepiota fuliginosa MF-IS2 TaxID=1400762 RepID=A0A9P5XPJ7_9AGAR|nr:hypothetical protein P691DRAFT_810923 [Macrolepiota fuliginosa MF-IS2]